MKKQIIVKLKKLNAAKVAVSKSARKTIEVIAFDSDGSSWTKAIK